MNDPKTKNPLSPHAAVMGRVGGKSKSPAKIAAAKRNIAKAIASLSAAERKKRSAKAHAALTPEERKARAAALARWGKRKTGR